MVLPLQQASPRQPHTREDPHSILICTSFLPSQPSNSVLTPLLTVWCFVRVKSEGSPGSHPTLRLRHPKRLLPAFVQYIPPLTSACLFGIPVLVPVALLTAIQSHFNGLVPGSVSGHKQTRRCWAAQRGKQYSSRVKVPLCGAKAPNCYCTCTLSCESPTSCHVPLTKRFKSSAC